MRCIQWCYLCEAPAIVHPTKPFEYLELKFLLEDNECSWVGRPSCLDCALSNRDFLDEEDCKEISKIIGENSEHSGEEASETG
jgi:hypothetical protein